MTLRVLTWHVHGNYLWYLSEVPVTWCLPVTTPPRPPCHGRGTSFPFPANVVEVPAEHLRDLDVDVVLHQDDATWFDRHQQLGPRLVKRPAVFLEHDAPFESATDSRHPVADEDALLVHVTAFNRMMWDNGSAETVVVEHGVRVPDEVTATCERARGAVVVNDLPRRGRRLGADLVARWRTDLPLDLIGMGNEEVGGIGEVSPPALPAALAPYRFLLHPARFTSLGLTVLEAMMVGLPVLALATTEMPAVIRDGCEGFIATDPDLLTRRAHELVGDRDLALEMGRRARTTAHERFSIDRFAADWCAVLERAAR